MSVKIEVHSDNVDVRSGTSAKGRPYTIREQFAYVQLGNDPYPTKIKLNLKEGQLAYRPGHYVLHDSSFYVDQYSNLQVSVALVPAPAQQAKPGA